MRSLGGLIAELQRIYDEVGDIPIGVLSDTLYVSTPSVSVPSAHNTDFYNTSINPSGEMEYHTIAERFVLIQS